MSYSFCFMESIWPLVRERGENQVLIATKQLLTLPGAYEQEHATPLYFYHSVFIDRFIFKSNLPWMRLPWECHNQSQDTNWRHRVTGPELPFFHKRKGVLKIDQSVKMPWHRLSMRVSSSCLSAPDLTQSRKVMLQLTLTSFTLSV